MDINGATPPPELQGLNDVVLVPGGMGQVRFIADFLDFADDTIAYMYHCHMLPHEDGGMMGQFLVVDPNAGIEELSEGLFSVYPNPSNGLIHVKLNTVNEDLLVVTDLTGRVVEEVKLNGVSEDLKLELAGGVYHIQVGKQIEKVVVTK